MCICFKFILALNKKILIEYFEIIKNKYVYFMLFKTVNKFIIQFAFNISFLIPFIFIQNFYFPNRTPYFFLILQFWLSYLCLPMDSPETKSAFVIFKNLDSKYIADEVSFALVDLIAFSPKNICFKVRTSEKVYIL